MFAFHETTRRRICRTAFVLLCLAPTLWTAAWIIQRRLPTYGAAQAMRLSNSLQVRAELMGYGEPRPQSVRCARLTLSDPATGQALVRMQAVRVHRNGAGSVISAADVTIDVLQFGALASKACSWLTDEHASATDFQIGQLTLNLPSAGADDAQLSIVLDSVQARAERDATGAAQLRIAVRPPGTSPIDKPGVQFFVRRSSAGPESAATAILETALPLPASALAGVPGLDALDAEASFTGAIQWTIGRTGLSGVAKGRLEGVALEDLFPLGSPHVATGRVSVTLAELRWRDRRLERLEGSLAAVNAEVSESVLAAAAKHLYCVPVSDGVALEDLAPMIAVDRLACRFVLNRKGLTLTGDMPLAEKLPAGCLATSGGVALLMQPRYIDVPAGAWVQFVAGPADSWVPASAGAVKVAERLPLPQ
jgi:hypothetical protein